MRKNPIPQDHHLTLEMVLLQGPRVGLFLMSELSLELIPFLSVLQHVDLEDLRYKPRRVCMQGYLAHKSEVENAHPPRTPLGP